MRWQINVDKTFGFFELNWTTIEWLAGMVVEMVMTHFSNSLALKLSKNQTQNHEELEASLSGGMNFPSSVSQESYV